jgi:hypothetical protein
MKSRITPSFQPSLSIDKKYHRKRLATKENMTRSVKKVMFLTEKGAASSVIPKIKVMLMKPLPTIFPKPKAECPPRKAFTVVENSGRLVPKAMIVAPIIDSDTPANSAIVTEDSTMK